MGLHGNLDRVSSLGRSFREGARITGTRRSHEPSLPDPGAGNAPSGGYPQGPSAAPGPSVGPMTKRPALAVLFAVSLTAALAGCGYVPISGPRVTEDRDVEDFTAIVLKTNGDVVVTVGDTPSLTITARAGAMGLLTSEVHDGVLTLSVNGPHLGLGEVDYALAVPMISDITIDGAGDVNADFTGARDIHISIAGSGDIDGTDIDATTVVSSIEGSGDIELTGRADDHTLEIDGAGNFDGKDFVTKNAGVSISGSGDVEVNVTGRLRAEISGSGEVRYTGGADVESDVSGSGTIVEDD